MKVLKGSEYINVMGTKQQEHLSHLIVNAPPKNVVQNTLY